MSFRPAAIIVKELNQVGEARRAAALDADRLGFDQTSSGKLAIIVTEAATNLVKHAGGGEVLLRSLHDNGVHGIEVLVLDKGPGMSDVGRCLAGGYSTAGTTGQGLGAIARLADEFDIFTTPGTGTVLSARVWSRSLSPADRKNTLHVGLVHLAKAGETVSGDAWAIEERNGTQVILVVDGLGHGPLAAEAADIAVRIFRENAQESPAEILRSIHAALRSTRGAAAAVAAIDLAAESIRYAGLGNISGVVITGDQARSMASHNGTVGHEARRFHEFAYPFPRGSMLVMHSDGLGTHWRMDQYPGLITRHPSMVAGVLYRDFTRGRDDVTVLAVHEATKAA